MLDSPTAPRCFSSLMEVNIEIDASKIEEMTVADTAVEFGQEPMESDETVFQKADANYNHILRMLGSPGRYQILLLILLGIGTMSATISDFVSIFYTIPPKATYCKIPEQHTKNGLIPLCYHQLNRTMEKSGVGSEFLYVKLDSEFCRIMPTGDPSEMSQEEAGCRGWPCDYEILHNFTYPRQWTVIAQYELSCSSYWMFTFSLVLYFAGAFVGTIMMEMFAKKLGYKLNMFARFAFYIVLCVGIGLEKVLWLFVLLRFLLGALAHSLRYSCLRLMFDLLPVEQRTASAAALSLSSGFGLIFLSALAFAVRDWRYILIAASAVCFVGLAYQWTVPESLQWLMSRNRILPAQQVFYKILANNRQFVPAGVEVAITNAARSMTKAEQSEQSWTVLLRSPASFRSFLAIIGLCFLTTIINYGILLSIPQLGGGVYFNVLISGVFDIFATLSTWIALRKMHVGRVLFVTAFMSGLLILAAGLIPGGFAMESTIEATRAALVLLGRVGTGTCSFLLYDVIFRVIPLGTQSSVIGLFSIVGITGASVAPLFVHLGRINHEVEFTLLGLMCVCSSFLSFALPPDVPKDLSKGMSDSNVNEALNDPSADEELVFEQLPDISAKSPYVL